MVKKNIVVVKVPVGSSPPNGFTFVRSVRGKDIYQKDIKDVSKKQVDDLTDIFGGLNVQVLPEDEVSRLLESMTLGGKRRSRRRRTKKSRKTRKSKKNY
jgi:hypothetical protein